MLNHATSPARSAQVALMLTLLGAAACGVGPPVLLGECPMFPPDNPWNQDVSGLPVDPGSARYIASIGSTSPLRPDFGEDQAAGIPYLVVPPSQPMTQVRFLTYPRESDPGPYPIPPNAPVEKSGDSHVLVVRTGECRLYELFAAEYNSAQGAWDAANGAIFDLRSNRTRPANWTSADAAGLPVLPGLVRYDEIQAGEIRHALRFTVPTTQAGFIAPATHATGRNTDPAQPPMGLRLRLSARVDLSRFTGATRIILRALQRYGMLVADNGGAWFLTGAPDPRWQDEDLRQLRQIRGSDFEVVQTGPIQPRMD